MSQTGTNAIFRRLGSVKAAIEQGRFVEAVERWAKIEFIPRARALAPRRTGDLMDSISFISSAAQVFVFAGASYSSHVEFGTYKMRPQPFMGPAFRAARPLLSKYTRRVIREALK